MSRPTSESEGLFRPEFDEWLRSYRAIAPDFVPADQEKIDGYYRELAELPVQVARYVLDLRTRCTRRQLRAVGRRCRGFWRPRAGQTSGRPVGEHMFVPSKPGPNPWDSVCGVCGYDLSNLGPPR